MLSREVFPENPEEGGNFAGTLPAEESRSPAAAGGLNNYRRGVSSRPQLLRVYWPPTRERATHTLKQHTYTLTESKEIRDLRSTVMADSPQPKQLEVRGKHRAVRSRSGAIRRWSALFSSRSTVKAVIKYSVGQRGAR